MNNENDHTETPVFLKNTINRYFKTIKINPFGNFIREKKKKGGRKGNKRIRRGKTIKFQPTRLSTIKSKSAARGLDELNPRD